MSKKNTSSDNFSFTQEQESFLVPSNAKQARRTSSILADDSEEDEARPDTFSGRLLQPAGDSQASTQDEEMSGKNADSEDEDEDTHRRRDHSIDEVEKTTTGNESEGEGSDFSAEGDAVDVDVDGDDEDESEDEEGDEAAASLRGLKNLLVQGLDSSGGANHIRTINFKKGDALPVAPPTAPAPAPNQGTAGAGEGMRKVVGDPKRWCDSAVE